MNEQKPLKYCVLTNTCFIKLKTIKMSMEYLTEMQKIVDKFFSSSKVLSYYSRPRLHLAERKLFKKIFRVEGQSFGSMLRCRKSCYFSR